MSEKKKWTPQQQAAIDARGCNILVSAAAGSGKTAVLTERVVGLLKENPALDIDSMLIVTFTRKAAAEMKSRIATALKENNLNRQLMLLPSSQICTIDSFCINLVRENFNKVGTGDDEPSLTNDFTIMDQKEENSLKNSALQHVINEFFEEEDADFISLYNMFSTAQKKETLTDLVKELHNYIYVQASPFEWLDEKIESYNPSLPFEGSVWHRALKDECGNLASSLTEPLEDIIALLSMLDPDEKTFSINSKEIWNQTANEESISKNGTDVPIKTLIDFLYSMPELNVKDVSKYGNAPETTMARLQKDCAACNEIGADQQNFVAGNLSLAISSEYDFQLKKLYPMLKCLSRVVKAYDKELMRQKSERNRYTFSDIQHFALSLLTERDENGKIIPSETALSLQGSYSEILVDEYQDTNEVQDMLFSVLSNGKNLFMVGDVKQSIYRFRLAMPQIFIEKKNTYGLYGETEPGEPSQIILDKNFRSRSEICDYVNFMFSNFMSEEVGEIDYNKSEYLNCGAEYEETDVPSVQIKILADAASQTDERSVEEARCVAEMINKKMAAGERIKDGAASRPIRYSDFALLFRKAKGKIGIYASVLKEYGIPCVCNITENLFDYGEIKLLLSYLRVINNPASDIDLLNVMLSPLYSFTSDDIANIKIESNNLGGKTAFHQAVLNSQSEKVISFLEDIKMLGHLSLTMSTASFIRYLCEYKNIYAFSNALSDGEQRYDNIHEFISFAESFDSSDSLGLASFLRLVDKVGEADTEFQSAGGEDAVTLTTVHKSKGLEYPIVVYVNTANDITKDSNSVFCLNQQSGIGMNYFDSDGKYKRKTVQYDVVQRQNEASQDSEALRVLYVAITRAKEQFISFITLKGKNSLEKKVKELDGKICCGKVNPYYCASMKSDADYILAGAMMHKDGAKLYTLAGMEPPRVPGNWNFPIDIELLEEPTVPEEEEREVIQPNPQTVLEIGEKLKYRYATMPLSNLEAKRNASSLDEKEKDIEFMCTARPAFMEEGKLTPSEKGTAMHAFMQFCDYEGAKNNLENEIARLQANGCLTEKEAASLDRKKLSALFGGSFAKRIFSADKIYREIKVTSFETVKELDGLDFPEEVLVQGISDCVFEENGKLVLVDYKTDSVKTENELVKLYKNQLEFYKKAVAKTLDKEISEAYLYSFALGKPVRV